MQENAIVISNLTKSFKKLHILKGINFSIKKGATLALLGPNGAGKTTIVKILSTILDFDQGKIHINDFDLVKDQSEIRKIIGLTGQYAAVDEYLTGRDNLKMMGRLYHLDKNESKKRADELLRHFDLVEAGNRPAKTYSGGMRRRLDLAASLVATPPIVFLDEPTTGLDPRSRIAMWEIIHNLKKQGVTILLTTQYLEEADRLADQIAVIDQGKVIALGTADELKSKVGKNRLELVFSSPDRLHAAEKILTGKNLIVDNLEAKIQITIDRGVKEVKEILDLMEANDLQIESMSLHKPTLDDVFLKLTGHQAEEPKNEK